MRRRPGKSALKVCGSTVELALILSGSDAVEVGGMVSQPLNSGAQPRSAVETAVLECTRGRWNSWCSGEMLRYHEELRLRRQPAGV